MYSKLIILTVLLSANLCYGIGSNKGFIGLTSKTYDGKMSSIDGGIAMSMACIEEYPLAYACTHEEIKNNLESLASFEGTNVFGKKAWLSNNSCKNFTDNIRSHKNNLGISRINGVQKRRFEEVLHQAIVLKVPNLAKATCNEQLPIACCR